MSPKNLDKYLYVRTTPTGLIRTVFLFAVATWVLVMIGYVYIVRIDWLYRWLMGPLILYFSIYYILSYTLNFFYTQFDVHTHLRRVKNYWQKNLSPPEVDVFLPICGESIEVLEKTWAAVKEMDYPRLVVSVLDDKGLAEYEALAARFGFQYLSRPNKGQMKKAGNIKYAYERTHGEFIVIFDADFAPHPDFIRELLPYFTDKQVAIVQSPQYFQTDTEVHDRSPLEYGASNVQEDFYRFIQVARSNLGAPVCCGSNAIYRRIALDSIGGTVQIEHSEDMYTGFYLMAKGWRVIYVPIILAVGLCPDNLHSYFHQQHRWCSGNLQLVADRNFWSSPLTIGQKMCFFAGFLYYFSCPCIVLFSFNSFFVLLSSRTPGNLETALFFVPCIIFSFVVMPLARISKERLGNFYARMACIWSYCHAIGSFLKRSTVAWQPTNAKKSGVSAAYRETLYILTGYSFVYFGMVGAALHRKFFLIWNLNYLLITGWLVLNIVLTVIVLSQFYFTMREAETVPATRESGNSIGWKLRTASLYLISVLAIVLCVAML